MLVKYNQKQNNMISFLQIRPLWIPVSHVTRTTDQRKQLLAHLYNSLDFEIKWCDKVNLMSTSDTELQFLYCLIVGSLLLKEASRLLDDSLSAAYWRLLTWLSAPRYFSTHWLEFLALWTVLAFSGTFMLHVFPRRYKTFSTNCSLKIIRKY